MNEAKFGQIIYKMARSPKYEDVATMYDNLPKEWQAKSLSWFKGLLHPPRDLGEFGAVELIVKLSAYLVERCETREFDEEYSRW